MIFIFYIFFIIIICSHLYTIKFANIHRIKSGIHKYIIITFYFNSKTRRVKRNLVLFQRLIIIKKIILNLFLKFYVVLSQTF